MRYVFIPLVFGLMMPLSACMSDNYDYVSSFQPDYYNDTGLRFGYATGQRHLRDFSDPHDRELRR